MDRILILLFYIVLFLIMYIDINKKYIPNILNILILFLAFFIDKKQEITYFFIGSAIYTLPIVLFYGYISDFVKKEVIGFGDVKLIIALGGLLYSPEINIFLQIYLFYLLVYLIATIFIIFLFIYNKCFAKNTLSLKNKVIAFAPFICLSFLILYNSNISIFLDILNYY